MVIDELFDVLPRPETPVETGTEEGWLEVFHWLGNRVPQDYIEFIKAYGTGIINEWLIVFNPFAERMRHVMPLSIPFALSQLRRLRKRDPQSFPYPLYFEPGGIIPWGQSGDGHYFCWLPKRLQGYWETVVLHEHTEPEHFSVSMTQFLARTITGEIESTAIPEDYNAPDGPRFDSN